MFVLYDVSDDFSLNTISGKSQYGDLAHAKKRAKEDYHGKKITWRKDTRIPGPKRYYGYNKQNELINAIFEHPNRKKVKGNPKRKKTMRKKKRSAKQLANDRRLGRMAKARAKAKRGGRRKKTVRKKTRSRVTRKVARKKNVHATRRKRTSLEKSHLWRVFRCRGKSVFWILMNSDGKWNWTKDAGKAILFATKQGAGNVARGIAKKRGYAAYQLGAAPREMSAAQIASQCGGKV